MDFDFHKTYAGYSNVQLLLIAAEPGKYQPAAVAAAKGILDSRTITDAERDAVAAQLTTNILPGRKGAFTKAAAIQQAKEWNEGSSIFDETEEQQAAALKSLQLWRWLIVAGLGLPGLYSLYTDCYYVFSRLTAGQKFLTAYSIIDLLFGFLLLALLAVGIAMFLSGKQAGWILLGAITAYYLCADLWTILLSLSYHIYSFLPKNILFLCLNGGVLLLLWQPVLKASYKVTTRTALSITIAAGAVCLLIRLAVLFFR